jgi:hypothetical protein
MRLTGKLAPSQEALAKRAAEEYMERQARNIELYGGTVDRTSSTFRAAVESVAKTTEGWLRLNVPAKPTRTSHQRPDVFNPRDVAILGGDPSL